MICCFLKIFRIATKFGYVFKIGWITLIKVVLFFFFSFLKKKLFISVGQFVVDLKIANMFEPLLENVSPGIVIKSFKLKSISFSAALEIRKNVKHEKCF